MLETRTQKNTFSGPDSLRDFLNPRNHQTPLVELPANLNPFLDQRVRIFAKLMNMLPLANVKSTPAFNMLSQHSEQYGLDDIHTLIENSSGNTVSSLAIIGRSFGIPTTKTIVSNETSPAKIQLMRFFGTEVTVNVEPQCPNPNDQNAGIYKARLLGKQAGWLNPGQYENPANPQSHEMSTGPQIWEQTDGNLTLLCAGLGTTGTMTGTASYLRQQNPDLTTVGVTRRPYESVPGVRTTNLLGEIAFDWQKHVDHLEEVDTAESYLTSLKLCRQGLLVGPSSGLALAGLLNFLGKQNGDFSGLRNSSGEVIATIICPDSPLPYIPEYFEYLEDKHFPPVNNEQLLNKKIKTVASESAMDDPFKPRREVKAAYSDIYSITASALKRALSEGLQVELNPKIKLIDVRPKEAYDVSHLPGSENISHREILQRAEVFAQKWKEQVVYMICHYGYNSELTADVLMELGVTALSIKGGVEKWIDEDLPLAKDSTCVIK